MNNLGEGKKLQMETRNRYQLPKLKYFKIDFKKYRVEKVLRVCIHRKPLDKTCFDRLLVVQISRKKKNKDCPGISCF